MIPKYSTALLNRHPSKRSYSVDVSELEHHARGMWHYDGAFILTSTVTGRDCLMVITNRNTKENEVLDWTAQPAQGEEQRLGIDHFFVTIWND